MKSAAGEAVQREADLNCKTARMPLTPRSVSAKNTALSAKKCISREESSADAFLF
jgi:hypothetical protein